MQAQQDQNSQGAGFTLSCIAFDKLWSVFSESEGNLKVPRQVWRLVIECRHCLPVPWQAFISLSRKAFVRITHGFFFFAIRWNFQFLTHISEIRDTCDGILTNWLHFSSCRAACNMDLESAFNTKLSQIALSCNTFFCWPVLGGDVGEDLAGSPLLRAGQQARSPSVPSGWPAGC